MMAAFQQPSVLPGHLSSPDPFMQFDSFIDLGTNSPFDDRTGDGQVDGLYTNQQAFSQTPFSSFQPINANNLQFSPKHNPSTTYHSFDSVLSGTSGPTHINPTATWNALQSLETGKSNMYRQKHGQLTPPDDLSPETPSMPLYSPNGFQDEPRSAVQEEDPTTPPKSATKRKVKSVSKTEGDGATSKRFRKNSKATKELPGTPENSEEEAKREKFLERNRIAASKCRQKKKEWTNGLENRARELTAERAHLNAYVASLRDELLYLKGECLKHTDCGCTKIREYLGQTVASMAPASAALYNLNLPDNKMTEDRKPSMTSGTSGFGSPMSDRHSRQGSMSDSIPDSAVTDEDMRSMLSASLARQTVAGGGRSQAPYAH